MIGASGWNDSGLLSVMWVGMEIRGEGIDPTRATVALSAAANPLPTRRRGVLGAPHSVVIGEADEGLEVAGVVLHAITQNMLRTQDHRAADGLRKEFARRGVRDVEAQGLEKALEAEHRLLSH